MSRHMLGAKGEGPSTGMAPRAGRWPWGAGIRQGTQQPMPMPGSLGGGQRWCWCRAVRGFCTLPAMLSPVPRNDAGC